MKIGLKMKDLNETYLNILKEQNAYNGDDGNMYLSVLIHTLQQHLNNYGDFKVVVKNEKGYAKPIVDVVMNYVIIKSDYDTNEIHPEGMFGDELDDMLYEDKSKK